MKKKPSFFRQAGVLIDRYFHIFFNDKQNLILTVAIPLLTILIVCFVACPDMYAVKPEDSNSINNSYPVLNWEQVVQMEKDDDDPDKLVEIETDEVTVSKWNGKDNSSAPTSPTKVDGENYFLITDAEQLAFLSNAASSDIESVRDYLTYNYILQVDIDLNSHEFTPIGTKKYPFTGTFDGNGHIIKNLKIDSDSDNVGFFGYVKSNERASSKVSLNDNKLTFYHNGIIKNFQIKNAEIVTSGKNAGVIAGCIDGTSRVTSVSAKGGSVSSDKGFVGSIVGKAVSSEAEIYVCYSTSSIKSKGPSVGGLVGDLGSARLSGAYSTSKIKFNGKNGNEKQFGAVIGCCDDYEKQIKNVYYDSKVMDKSEVTYGAINDSDHKGYAIGVETEDLHNYASFLVPFKGIETAYEIENPADEDKDEDEDEDYDPEEDKDIDPTYGFKKDDQLEVFGGTQTGLFMLVCVAIFVGICNSIQEICKERNILKREYMTNLSLGSYVLSKLVVQAVVCAVQMVVVMFIYYLFVKNKMLPESGLIFSSIWTEYYITLFLLAFASDTMSLVISSIVKTSATANTFIPIILIVQIVFSGVLFDMDGALDALSKLMISKWGIAALAATSQLNDSQQSFLINNPSFQLKLGSEMSTVKDLYSSTVSNLLMIWTILLIFIIVCSVLCRILLIRVKNDKR